MGAWWSDESANTAANAGASVAANALATAEATSKATLAATSEPTVESTKTKSKTERELICDNMYIVTEFFPSGAKCAKYTEYDGHKHGNYTMWDELGKQVLTARYNYGELMFERKL